MENTNSAARQTAHIVSISSIHRAMYTKTEGEWEPNYLLIKDRKVSRANLMGVVISGTAQEGAYSSFTIDDSTGTISVRIFEDSTKHEYELGDVVMVIGKIREFNSEKYIVPEIIRKIDNEVWLDVRKKELEKIDVSMLDRVRSDEQPMQASTPGAPKQEPAPREERASSIEKEIAENAEVLKESTAPQSASAEDDVPTENNTEKVFNLIKKLDTGDGANIEEVIEESGLSDCEDIIEALLNEGEIFEVKPGHLKVLE